MKTMDFIIGDIHGCFDELQELVTLCAAHSNNSYRIIACGDLIDRGPKSKEVLDIFINNENFLSIAGNHEQEFLSIYAHYRPKIKGNREMPLWYSSIEEIYDEDNSSETSLSDFADRRFFNWFTQGGRETLKSLGLDLLDPKKWNLDNTYLDFLFSLPLFISEKNYFLSHALIKKDDYKKLINLKEVPKKERRQIVFNSLWNRDLDDLYSESERPFISGHTPHESGVKYLNDKRVIQIDTACCYGHSLSAWCEDGSILEIKKP